MSARTFTARVAATGPHRRKDGTVHHRGQHELRAIVRQLPATPLTLDHPPHTGDATSFARTPDHTVGYVHSARLERGDDGVSHALATIVVTDPRAQAAIDSGARAVSLGYACHLGKNGNMRGTKVDHVAVGIHEGRIDSCRIVDEVRR